MSTNPEGSPTSTQLLTIDEVAELLQISPRSVRRLVARGQFPAPAVRLSRKVVRWSLAQITALANQATSGEVDGESKAKESSKEEK